MDPIDGTMNFVHKYENCRSRFTFLIVSYPVFCISIGLIYDGIPIVGVVYNPSTNELFSAAFGQGATLNGQPIHVSSAKGLEESLVITEFTGSNGAEETIELVKRLMQKCHSVRMLGSAAIDLCYVAIGRVDAYVMRRLKCWDICAGIVIVREAGGVCMDYSRLSAAGTMDIFKGEIIATASRDVALQIHDLLPYKY